MAPVDALPLAEDDVLEFTPMVGDPTGTSWATLPEFPVAWDVMLQSM
jgi:hypothetical protein